MTKPAKKKLTKAQREAEHNKLVTEAIANGEGLQAILYQSATKQFAGDGVTLDQQVLTDTLAQQAKAIANGDTKALTTLLASQVQTLSAMFTKYGVLATQNTGLQALDTCAKIALRAQSQCRATAEAISAIQNPPHATFMTQNNISHGAPQQVNNGRREGIEQQQADPVTETLNQPREAITNG